MPLKVGTKSIGAIYKGTQEISKIYKGTTLVYENAKWLPYSFEYLYYSLIPQTVDSKTVKTSSKIDTIYANGVIENQFVIPVTTDSDDTQQDVRIQAFTNGRIIITGTASGSNTRWINKIGAGISFVQGHKYLFTGTSNISLQCSSFSPSSFSGLGIYTASTTSSNSILLYYASGKVFNEDFYFNVIDLTLMFGTGNEPTTLTDNRIQALLNRGYIAYNTGTYKSTSIGAFKSEPYNLFDFDNNRSIGFINNNYTMNLKYCFYTPNFLSVLPNTSYTFSASSSFQIMRIVEYDKDYNYIKESDGGSWQNKNNYTTTLTANTYFVKLTFANTNNQVDYTQIGIPTASEIEVCFHRTGTRTGYAPYTEPQTLSFKYQGNGAISAHDSFEVTKTSYVFTKNVGVVDLGSLSWTYDSSHTRFYSQELSYVEAPTDNDTIANMLCDKYTTMKQQVLFDGSDNNAISFSSGGRISVRNTAYTDATTFTSAMSGVMLYYEFATPQVLTIPKQRLGIVDLGTLNWLKESYTYNESSVYRFKAQVSDIQVITSTSTLYNICCSKYITDTAIKSYRQQANQIIALDTNRYILINDTNYTDAATFKAAMSGIYLFYQTEGVVDDIDTKLSVESGGTLTAAEYTYVENQLVQASNLLPTSSFTQYGVTFSRNTTDKSVTISGLCSNSMTIDITSSISVTAGHVYWLFSGITGTANTYHIVEVTGNKKSYQGSIFTLSGSTAKYAVYINSGYNIDLTFKPQIVDLTLMFGSGNEPTSTSDSRMQDLINRGYIEYNTGENKIKVCDVLPNATFNFKCK